MTQSATGIAVGCAIGIPVGIVALIAGVMWIKMQKRFAKEIEMDNDDIDKFNEEDLDLQNIYDNTIVMTNDNNANVENTKYVNRQSVDPFVCDSSDLEMNNGECKNSSGSQGNGVENNKSNAGSKENFDHDSTATATNSTATNTTTTINANATTNNSNSNNNNNSNNKDSRYVPAYKRNLKKSLSIFKEGSNSGNTNNNNARSVQYVNGNATEGSLSTESNNDSGESNEQNSTSSRVTPVSNALPQQQQQQQQHEFHRIEQDIYDTYVPFDDSPLKGSGNTFESPGNVFATPQSKSNSNSSSIGNMKGLEKTFNSISNLASKVNNKSDTHSDVPTGNEPRLHNSLSNEHLLMKNLSTKNYEGSYPRMNTERDKTKFTQTQTLNNQQQLKKEITNIARTPSRKRSMYITDDPNDISSVFDESD